MLNKYIERFRSALKIQTDWATSDKIAIESSLSRFQDFLKEAYPAFHKAAECHILSPYAVAYRWPGASPEKLPVLLMGHYDVVPAETEKWSVEPFGAEMKDDFIYGRGALDMKNIVIAIMEGAENLCTAGFKPKGDVWIAWGGDEERSGSLGAVHTAKWFKEKGVKFSYVIDEGTPVAVDQIRGVQGPLALIGIEEKGFLSLRLEVEQKPGHASQPPEEQAAAILGRALINISKRPFPWLLTPAVEAFFKSLAPHVTGISSFVMKNARLLGPLFFKVAATGPSTRALLRNTVAMTMLEGSMADNVMPSLVRGVINLRLLPPWTVEEAIRFIESSIADDRVKVSIHGFGSNPMKSGPDQASQKSPGWKEIFSAFDRSFPGVPVLPFLMPATTDSRHYKEVADYIFRFCPFKVNPEEMSRIHGHDERISIENLQKGLEFYTALMEQF